MLLFAEHAQRNPTTLDLDHGCAELKVANVDFVRRGTTTLRE
jgi:hypothetical protein